MLSFVYCCLHTRNGSRGGRREGKMLFSGQKRTNSDKRPFRRGVRPCENSPLSSIAGKTRVKTMENGENRRKTGGFSDFGADKFWQSACRTSSEDSRRRYLA